MRLMLLFPFVGDWNMGRSSGDLRGEADEPVTSDRVHVGEGHREKVGL